MNNLNKFGIGPRLGIVVLPWLAIAIILSMRFKSTFDFIEGESKALFYAGLILVIFGAVMYFATAPYLLKGLRENRLVTSGTYYFCCNPLYAAIILLIIPGISLMMNTWLILTTSLVAYILFKMYIKSEYAELEKFFGEYFRQYRSATPELFPFPRKSCLNEFGGLM